MANTPNFVGYMHAPGNKAFMRVFAIAFTSTYAQNNAELVNLATALNPYGIEDPAYPGGANFEITPLVLGSTLNGWKPEVQIAGSGTSGQFGVNFWNGTTQMAASTAYSADFPANTATYLPSGTFYGELLIGVLSGQ